jgi:hypothetical protein
MEEITRWKRGVKRIELRPGEAKSSVAAYAVTV